MRIVTSINTLIKSSLQFVLVFLFVFLGLGYIVTILMMFLGKLLVLLVLRIHHLSIRLSMLDRKSFIS